MKSRRYQRRELKAFEPVDTEDIIKLRIKHLEFLKESKNKETELRLNKLKSLLNLFKKTDGKREEVTDVKIRKLLENEFPEDYPKDEPLEFIGRYSDETQNHILPDIMELEYEDIPDENGLSKYEILRIIQMYNERIIEIKNQERKLYSKLDCAVFAEQYLDTMDQIATLYRKKLFPQNAVTYFENYFGYGINLMNWYYKYLLKFEYNGEKLKEFNPKEKITQVDLEKEEERWVDFRWLCRGGDTRKNPITKFAYQDTSMQKSIVDKISADTTLPMTMYQYEDLPEEAGIKPDDVLEILKEYSDSLIKLTEKETTLQTQVDCALYAEQYLDILDQIAYLLNTKALVTDSSTFFENNFSFGLTLKIWYDLKVAGAEGQEGRWSEFIKYCDEFQDDEYNYLVLTPFSVKDVLPVTMLFIEMLPIDLTQKRITKEYPKKKNGKLKIPIEYYRWEDYYKYWLKLQKTIIVNKKDDLKKRQSIQTAIKNFDEIRNNKRQFDAELGKLEILQLEEQIKNLEEGIKYLQKEISKKSI